MSSKTIYSYYVYAYLREDGSPYYIGKGKDHRAYSKNHNVKLPPEKNRIVFLETNLSNIGALALECRYIRWYGRKDNNTGILRNLTDGGEGATGSIRKDLRKYNKNRIHPFQTQKRPDHSKIASKSNKQRWKNMSDSEKVIIKNNISNSLKHRNANLTEDEKQRKKDAHNITTQKQIGKLWWSNGIITVKSKDCPGIEWVRGRTKRIC